VLIIIYNFYVYRFYLKLTIIVKKSLFWYQNSTFSKIFNISVYDY
jgi:hypothetical protein